jgi:NAD(P)-dependent dehydrogenase (short-subunit alcohol dehydrogenase family)
MAEKSALIVGAGSGISAAFARALHRDGYKVALSARNTDKLAALAKETGAILIAADATKADAVKALFAEVDRALGRSTSSSTIRAFAPAVRSSTSTRRMWRRPSRSRPMAASSSARRRRDAWLPRAGARSSSPAPRPA